MVQLKYFAIFILCVSEKASSQLSKERVKRVRSSENDFESDLFLMPQQKKMMYTSMRLHKKEALFDLYKWPKNYEGFVIVPYWISRGALFSPDHLRLIRNAMESIERSTCVRFKVRKHEYDYLNIFAGKFCKSNLGRTGGRQDVSFNTARCFRKGHVMHELLHALGYIHMHNRPDRDNYINIVKQNVHPKFMNEFDIVNPFLFNYYGTPYDYNSIMHYGSKAASKNGGRTIITKDPNYINAIGQRSELSDGDIKRINVRYNCAVSKRSIEENSDFDDNFSDKPDEDYDDSFNF